MSRFLNRLGHFADGHPRPVLVAWVLIAVTAIVLNSSIGGTSNETFRGWPGS